MNPTQNTITNPVEARTHLWELIQDIRFAMFTTRHGNGHLHSRPMTTQNSKLDEDSSLWFFMSRAGEPVADLALAQVRITHTNYWDIDESKIVQLFHMAKAAVTGKPPTQLGEHAEIRMG